MDARNTYGTSFLFTNGAQAAQGQGLPPDSRIISIERPLHFSKEDGAGQLVATGNYRVTSDMKDVLMLTEESSSAQVAIKAVPLSHQEPIKTATAVLGDVEEGFVHLVLLFPDGHALGATGSLTGIVSRGASSKINVAAVFQASKLKMKVKNFRKIVAPDMKKIVAPDMRKPIGSQSMVVGEPIAGAKKGMGSKDKIRLFQSVGKLPREKFVHGVKTQAILTPRNPYVGHELAGFELFGVSAYNSEPMYSRGRNRKPISKTGFVSFSSTGGMINISFKSPAAETPYLLLLSLEKRAGLKASVGGRSLNQGDSKVTVPLAYIAKDDGIQTFP